MRNELRSVVRVSKFMAMDSEMMRGRAGGSVLPGRDSWHGVRLEGVSFGSPTADILLVLLPLQSLTTQSVMCSRTFPYLGSMPSVSSTMVANCSHSRIVVAIQMPRVQARIP